MNNIPNGYVSVAETRKTLKISSTSLIRWANAGKIDFVKNEGAGSHRFYNLKKYLQERGIVPIESTDSVKLLPPPPPPRRKICYCRVSTRAQRDDLGRQIELLERKYPNHEIIRDIGSGINFKRPGLRTLLDYAVRKELEEVVVAHKDRLCRFGFELFKYLIEEVSGGKIVVLNNHVLSPQEEMVTDVLAVLTVFSARLNGLRKYKKQISEDNSISKKSIDHNRKEDKKENEERKTEETETIEIEID